MKKQEFRVEEVKEEGSGIGALTQQTLPGLKSQRGTQQMLGGVSIFYSFPALEKDNQLSIGFRHIACMCLLISN